MSLRQTCVTPFNQFQYNLQGKNRSHVQPLPPISAVECMFLLCQLWIRVVSSYCDRRLAALQPDIPRCYTSRCLTARKRIPGRFMSVLHTSLWLHDLNYLLVRYFYFWNLARERPLVTQTWELYRPFLRLPPHPSIVSQEVLSTAHNHRLHVLSPSPHTGFDWQPGHI